MPEESENSEAPKTPDESEVGEEADEGEDADEANAAEEGEEAQEAEVQGLPEGSKNFEFEYRKQRYESYRADREAIRKESLELSGRYDKAVLALAGGSLALSITFLEKIAPHPEPLTFIFLAAAWLCLIISLLLELFALSTSQTAANEQIGVADQEYRTYLLSLPDPPQLPPQLETSETSEQIVDRLKKRMERFNDWSRWLLALGVCLLCTFSLLNLPFSAKNKESGDSTMSKPINESKGSFAVPKNALPPPPPPRPAAPAALPQIPRPPAQVPAPRTGN